MNNISGAVELSLYNFGLVYLLLIVVLFIMKKCNIKQNKLLFIASLRMTVQLILAGLVLSYVFKSHHPFFPLSYVALMMAFAIHLIFSRINGLSSRLKLTIICTFTLTCSGTSLFFIVFVVGESFFNPQYTIPLSGMIIGNALTGVTLGLKNLLDSLKSEKAKLNALLNIGAEPSKILLPFVNNAMETALLPTINSMLGMGIISLPGMMTGQILSGTPPSTAVLYQIAIVIAICAVVALSVFSTLYLGRQTFYNNRKQIILG